MPAVPFTPQRPSGSTRGFTTVDPERQGVLMCLADTARSGMRPAGTGTRASPRDLLAAAGPIARSARTLRDTPAR